MSVLSIYHPDIEEYINAKSWDEGKLVHFNLSVIVDNDFMNAVENDEDIFLHYPIYDNDGFYIKDESKWEMKKEIKAKYLWDLIMTKAYNNGEPGIFFDENLNDDNPLQYIERIVCTNPCAEYLGGTVYGVNPKTNAKLDSKEFGGACNLGSLFLHRFVDKPFTKDAEIDYIKLKNAIEVGVRALDNIIDINIFPNKIYENYQKSFRTIGLGITGLGDCLAMMNMKYGSKESLEFVDYLMEFIAFHSYRTSILLADEKGEFLMLNRKEFANCGFITKHIDSKNFDWNFIKFGILNQGIRNGKIISVAPVGTLSLTFGNNCSSGLEPIFSLEYDRKVKIGGQSDDDIQIVKMRDYAYEEWLKIKDSNNCIVKEDVFVTAMNLSVDDHINVLSKIAYHTDMSCSKTINVPSNYPYEDCKNIYTKCWKNGIKGCTIFRPNEIRQGILISETPQDDEVKEVQELKRGEWKSLAEDTIYIKKNMYSGCGKTKVFVGYSPSENQVQDVYIKRSSGGGCISNLEAVAIGISTAYRYGGNTEGIVKAYRGTGNCNSFLQARLNSKVVSQGTSCATAILKIIQEVEKELNLNHVEINIAEEITLNDKTKFSETEINFKNEHGEISFAKKFMKCPTCGESVRFEGGCLICPSCAWSKCE